MRIAEIILGVLVFAGVVLKFVGMTGSGLIIVFASGILACLYYMGALGILNGLGVKAMFKKSSYEHISTQRIIGSVLLGFIFSLLVLGVLFKIQMWPAGDIMLLTGLTGLALSAMVLFVKSSKSKDSFYKGALIRVFIIGAISTFLWQTSTNTLVDINYRDRPEYAKVYKEFLADPNNEEVFERLKALEEESYE